jgi:uncharacterized protein YjiS (DUF1127 family)
MDRTKGMAIAWRGVFVAPLFQAAGHLAEWRRRQQIRRAYGLTPEVLLRDIGLTPDDLVKALGQPLDKNASDTLVKAAVERAGNW